MSSILTNNGAMVALQTLKQTNQNMAQVQNQISTGKAVSSAKDNAATWAISKVMEADVAGFKAISDSLALGESTVAVARNASETVTDLLTEIKTKIISAQEENVDTGKIQTDIEALTKEIESVVGAAQFNGLNLINGKAESPVKVTASLDRGADGTVTAKSIDVSAADLSQEAGIDLTAGTAATTQTDAALAINDGTNNGVLAVEVSFADATGATGGAAALAPSDTTNEASTAGLMAGDELVFTINDTEVSYTVAAGDDRDAIAAGLNTAKTAAGISADITFVNDATNGLQLENASTTEAAVVASEAYRDRGDMYALSQIDVTDPESAEDALANIEGLLQTSIDTAASFGSVEKRIEIQTDFVGKLMDSMKSGIGSLVDADMEETSARLQALQVQQQLGVQALSMANQAPQSVLSLFR